MNLQRRNHYVAECLQEGFTDANGLVWVKFSDKPEPEHRNPRSVGRQRSLYIREVNGKPDDGVEKFLSHSVETPFAALARRVKDEREKFNQISTPEQCALLLFVATQTVRTLAHKHCVDVQAGRAVDNRTFLRTMLRQMHTMADLWLKHPPTLRFFTSLPYIGEHFIAGDHPVLVIQVRDNPVWIPTDEPKAQITQLNDILTGPNYGFWLPLSPYVCVSIQPKSDTRSYLPPEPLDPRQVRQMNQLLRDQCKKFILARDKHSLN